MSKNKLTYSINLEKVNNEVLSIRQVYDKQNNKRQLVIYQDNDTIPTKVDSWDELFDVITDDPLMKAILGKYEAN